MKMSVPKANRLYDSLRGRGPSAVTHRESSGAGVTGGAQRGPFAESFRLIAMNLSVMLPADARHGVVVMSANRGEGRSSVAVNLAIAMAERRPVLLVASGAAGDRDLGQLLRWHRNGNMDAVPAELRHAAGATEHPGVWVLTSHPSSNGTAPTLKSVVAEAERGGFFTIVDTPAALTSAAGFEFAREIGNVLYVLRRKAADMETHRRIRDQLALLGVSVVGLIINEG